MVSASLLPMSSVKQPPGICRHTKNKPDPWRGIARMWLARDWRAATHTLGYQLSLRNIS